MPDEKIKRVAALLDTADGDLKCEAASALSYQPNLSREVLLKMMTALEGDPNKYVRTHAARALKSQVSIPTDLIPQLVGLLGSSDETTSKTAIRVLTRVWPHFPHDTVETVVRLLDSPNGEIVIFAMDALRSMRRSDIPPSAVMKVASLCRRAVSHSTMIHIMWFLDNGIPLFPIEALQELVCIFRDPVTWGHDVIAGMLRRQTDLPESIIRQVAALLKPEGSVRSRSAADILIRYPVMSDEIFARLLSEMDSESFKLMYHNRLIQSTKHDGFAWQTDADGVSIIRLPEGSRKVVLDFKMKKANRDLQKEWKLPFKDFGAVLEP